MREAQRRSSEDLRETQERRARQETERRESQQRLVEAMRKDAAEKEQRRRDMQDPRLRGMYELQEHFRQKYGPMR